MMAASGTVAGTDPPFRFITDCGQTPQRETVGLLTRTGRSHRPLVSASALEQTGVEAGKVGRDQSDHAIRDRAPNSRLRLSPPLYIWPVSGPQLTGVFASPTR